MPKSFNNSMDRPIAWRDGESARPAGAVTLFLRLDGLRSGDGYEISLDVELPVGLHDSPIDRKAFAEKFLKQSPVGTAAHAAEFLQPQLATGVAAALAEQDVAKLMDAAFAHEIKAALKAAASKPLFAAGLQLEGEPEVRLSALEWQRRKVEEAAEAARIAAAEREGELLRRFEDIRRDNPDVPAGALLMGLPKAEREDALRALLKAGGQRTRSRLFAVAGDMLCEIEPAVDRVVPLELSSELGPLRSIRAITRHNRPHLLIGARDGVYLMDPDVPETAEAFDADVEGSPFGFSNLAYDESLDVIHATHADVGLVSWQVSLGTRTIHDKIEFADEQPRHIDARDGRTYIVAGGALYQESEGAFEPVLQGPSPIIHLAGTQRELIVFRQSGHLTTINRRDGSQRAGESNARGTPALAACLPWLGDVRLVVADEYAAALAVMGAHDSVTSALEGHHAPYKGLAAAPDLLAAISSDRQRLLCWRPWEETPYADLHVISRTRSRLADVAVL